MFHQKDNETATPEAIAMKFKLNVEDASNLVKYFAVFKSAQIDELGKPDMTVTLTEQQYYSYHISVVRSGAMAQYANCYSCVEVYLLNLEVFEVILLLQRTHCRVAL